MIHASRAAVLGPVLLLVAVESLATAQGPGTEPGDPAVAAIQIVGASPSWIHGEPTKPVVRVTVENRGANAASPYRINYHWVAGGQTTWLNGAESNSFDFQDAALGPGAKATHEAPWKLGEIHKGPGQVLVVIQPLADSNTGNNARTLGVFVPVHDLELSVLGGPQPIRPDETRFVRIQLENRGNLDEAVPLDLLNESAGPAARLDEDLESTIVTAPSGGSASTTLFVTYPFAGDTSPFVVAYDVAGATSYGRNLRTTTPGFASRYEQMPPPSPFGLERVDNQSLVSEPGGELNVTFGLTNLGDQSDVYLFDASGEPGWTVFTERSRTALMPGERTDFDVHVGFPEEAPVGSAAVAELEVRSNRASTPLVRELPLRVRGPAVRLEHPEDWPGQPYVGDPARVPVRIVNHGDQPTPQGATVTVRAFGLEPETVVNSTTVPPVPPGEHALVELGFDEYNQATLARFEATWTAPGAAMANEGFTVEAIVHKADLVVEAPPPLTGMPGEVVGYRSQGHAFRVRNVGNAVETILLRASSQHGTGSLAIGADPLVLGPGEAQSVPYNHTLPLPSGRLATANASLHASIAGRPDLAWNSTVATVIIDGRPPTMVVQPLPPLWALGQPMPIEVAAQDDSIVTSVEVTHTAPSGAKRALPLSAQLNGPMWALQVVLEETGNHSFVLTARDAAGHQVSSAPNHVEVRPVPPPVITLSGPEEAAAVAATDVFLVEVHDALPLQSVVLLVTDPYNRILLQRPLRIDDAGRAEFDLHKVPPGRVGVAVEATNSAGAHATVGRTAFLVVPPEPVEPISSPEEAAPASTPSATVPGASFAGALVAIAVCLRLGRRASGGVQR